MSSLSLYLRIVLSLPSLHAAVRIDIFPFNNYFICFNRSSLNAHLVSLHSCICKFAFFFISLLNGRGFTHSSCVFLRLAFKKSYMSAILRFFLFPLPAKIRKAMLLMENSHHRSAYLHIFGAMPISPVLS